MDSNYFGSGMSPLKKGERRSVNNSTIVMNSWKQFLDALGKDFDVFRGKDIMMCRKCFSAYERYGSLQKSISENLMHAMDVIELEAISAAKRPRMNTPVPSQASTSSSPDVAVSFFTF